jgi:sugar phosphate isomerase/epimerase
MTRREILAGAAALAGANVLPAQTTATKLKIAIFSKHLQFLEGAALAKAITDCGAEAIDLTVREGGHVEPARVKQDLPPLVKLLHDAGVETPMVTAGIVDANTPYSADILSTLSDLGIRYYRWGGFKWDPKKQIQAQIQEFRPVVAALAALNAKYQTTAMYHTHSGLGLVGASIWDLHEILQGQDPNLVSVNYDIGHATIEGGLGGWIESFRITGQHLKGIAVKDFIWEKNPKGVWREAWQPIGAGMVKFPQFFQMVKAAKFEGPLQLHFEYPLGGAENGKKTDLTMPPEQILAAIKRDTTALRSLLTSAGLS